jgi:hypothetical protein
MPAAFSHESRRPGVHLRGTETDYLWFTLALVALTLLMTGPGLWSEKWGWTLLKRLSRKGKPAR